MRKNQSAWSGFVGLLKLGGVDVPVAKLIRNAGIIDADPISRKSEVCRLEGPSPPGGTVEENLTSKQVANFTR
jgi:hypothetical protein